MTYTYAVLKVSPFVYDEIRGLLKARGYSHAFRGGTAGEVIDMHGIALQRHVIVGGADEPDRTVDDDPSRGG